MESIQQCSENIQCQLKQTLNWRQLKQSSDCVCVQSKFCKYCNTEKSIDNFTLQKYTKDGYRTMCRLCINKYHVKNYNENRIPCVCGKSVAKYYFKEHLRRNPSEEHTKMLLTMNNEEAVTEETSTKKCKSCQEVKDLSCFYINPSHKDKHNNTCKKCTLDYMKNKKAKAAEAEN